MKKTKKRALYIIAALLAALFVLSCLVGFAACGGGSGDPEEVPGSSKDDDTKKDDEGGTTATVTSVSISGNASTMTVGDTATLTASVVMSDNSAYTGSYSWSSSDSTKVSVSGSGATATVKAEAEGSATIKVAVNDSKSATYAIAVSATTETPTPTPEEPTVSAVSISGDAANMTVGGTATLTASVTMSDNSAYSGSYSWSSSDSTKVSVSGNGATATVTAEAEGSATITVAVNDSKSATYEISVSAVPTITSVALNQSTLSFEYGSSSESTLTATVTMSDGSDYEGDYAWTSSDTEEKVVKVTGSGASVTVNPVKCGTATITVSVGEGTDAKTATCTVTVSEDHEAAEKGRITGSADVADEDFHFMFADEYEEGTTVVFDDSSVSAEYDAETKTYTLNGMGIAMTEEQASAFYNSAEASSHVGHEYVGFIVNVNEGETIDVTTYTGSADETKEKDFTFTSPADDTSFLVDIEDHNTDGDWKMVLDVTYAGGDEETYTVVIGDIEKGVADETNLISVFDEGGDVTLIEDITLSDEGQTGTNAPKSAVQAGGSGRVQSPLYVADGVDVTLDLNGHTLARNGKDTGGYIFCTILVMEGGTLTVVDSSEDGSGVVDVTGHGNECLYNYGGTVTLEGGFFTRSKENGMSESNNGKDTEGGEESSYTIQNYGDLTIDGATVFNAGDYSTCVRSQGMDETHSANLTMISGKVYGGKYAVGSGSSSSDIHATFTMTGGTLGGLRSDTDALPYRALNNYDEATITGGTLLGGNGGAIDVGGKADACVEGVVIFNEDGGTGDTLTIGDGKGNGPEIIYEGINPDAATVEGEEIEETRMSYYEEVPDESGETVPKFATGIAVYSGEVDINAGTIKCTDTAEDRDYNFMGVYMTNGTLRATGGTISGDEAIVIDFTVATNPEIAYEVTAGCNLIGGIKIYDKDGQEVDASAYEPGDVVVPGADEGFTFNSESFDGFSGLDKDFTVTGDEDEEITYTAGDITVTEIVGSDGKITVVVDGIVANQMSDEQKVAFDASYETDADGTIRFYIAVKIAVKPGETVTVTGGGETETIENTGDEVIYTLWVIEIGQDHFTGVTAETVGDYLVVDLSSFKISVSVTDSDDKEKGDYTIAFGNVFVPLQAWRCASGQHTVSSWTVTEEETCGTAGSQTGVCDYCGETVTETIPATGNHTWDEGEVTTAPTCTDDGVLTKTCTVCGATETETIPALGHTAKTYSDGNRYAVYMATEEGDEEYAWYAFCETCEQWFVIDECETCDIYDLVLVANSEASLDAAIEVAKDRTDGSDTNRTQILVYGTIQISEDKYVTIDCDNVEIYGLGAENSKIIDSAYESTHSGTAQDGVEISGKNVTIRNLTIDGSKLNDSANHYNYEHGLEILGSAENVTLSNCVITGGTSDKSSAVVLMNGFETGYLLIENCTLSGYHGLTIEHDGSNLYVTISGGKIDGSYYGILIDAGSGVYLNVEGARINGKNSLTTNTTSATFTNCTFGYNVYENKAYGSMGVYCDVTLKGCTFLANDTECSDAYDGLVNNSRNYVIQARTADITIALIGCEFVNTNEDLTSGTLAVTADNFMYLVGTKSISCFLYFSDSEDALEYIYDSTAHTVEHNHDTDDWDGGTVTLEPTCTEVGEKTYTCGACGTKKTVEIPALGHTATEQSDGNMYAVYSEGSWYTQCERCGEWVVEIDDENIYDFILVAQNDEVSLNAAIAVAKARNTSDNEEITKILVYGTIQISETSYVDITCSNVEIYGLSDGSSKIVDSSYDTGSANNPRSGVEISGKNVTIRNLTIDGTALNNVGDSDTYNYKHAVEIKGGAENVLISDCVVTGGGTATNDSSICIMNGSGTVKIENCTLSGAASGLVIEYNGQSIEVDVSGGKIDAIRPIWIDDGNHVTLNVKNAELYGRSELGPGATITFNGCTFGYHYDEASQTAYGSVDVYGVITFESCKFLANDTEDVTLKDSILKESNNYVIGAYYPNVTIYLIECEFENTNSELVVEGAEDSMVAVNKDTFIYIVAGGNGVYGCSLYFDDSDDAVKYSYDATEHTVREYVEEPDDENP